MHIHTHYTKKYFILYIHIDMSIVRRYVPTGHDRLSVFHGNILPARDLPMEGGSPEENLKILDPGPWAGKL